MGPRACQTMLDLPGPHRPLGTGSSPTPPCQVPSKPGCGTKGLAPCWVPLNSRDLGSSLGTDSTQHAEA